MSEISFDEVYDYVAVGGGGGAMCAGLVMRDAGKSVLILEKTGAVGGTTARSGGLMWIPCNRFMKAAGIDDSFDKAMAYLDDVVGEDPTARGATRARRMKYVREASRMIDFLVDHGVKLMRADWPDYYDDRPGGDARGRVVLARIFDANALGEWKNRLAEGIIPVPATLPEINALPFRKSWTSRGLLLKVASRVIWQKLTRKRYVTAGQALQGRMLQAALNAGVEIRVDSPVEELLVEAGRIVGVQTVRDGKPWRIGCRLGVLVNAGGFSKNREMRAQYMPDLPPEWSSAAPEDTGEMIREMMRIGADVSQMEEVVGNQTTPVPDFDSQPVKPPIQGVTAKPHAILVDQSGRRYQNECGSYMAYCKAMVERNRTTPAIPSWAILDDQFIRKYMLGGTMPGRNKPASWEETGYLRKARSVGELAAKLDMAPDVLEATVERFNGFVDKGFDEDFHRGERTYDNFLGDPTFGPSNTLGRIETAPFYAVPVIPGDVGTYGGVVTDEYGRVLREDGTQIPGLYATGISTASAMGRFYPGAGCSIGPAFTWGYIAARHALGLDGEDQTAAMGMERKKA